MHNGFYQRSKDCNLSDICGDVKENVRTELVCPIVQDFYFPKLNSFFIIITRVCLLLCMNMILKLYTHFLADFLSLVVHVIFLETISLRFHFLFQGSCLFQFYSQIHISLGENSTASA